MEKRYIGIDLHRNRFTCCIRLENERTYLTDWELEDLGKFVKKLRPADEVAVEITGNTRLFFDAVAEHVARVVVVNTNQFRVIRQSVKKTDPNDARTLALYLSKNMLPEVRMKDKEHGQLASLTQTRDTLVKLRTALKNKINNIFECTWAESTEGIAVEREEAGRGAGAALRRDRAHRAAGDRRADSQSEQEHRRVGEDDWRGGFEAGRPQEPVEHQGDRQDHRRDSAERDWRCERFCRRGSPGQLLRHRAEGVELE